MLNMMQPSQHVLNEYFDYIKVAREFLEHVFDSQEEKLAKQLQMSAENEAINGEIERIQRTVLQIEEPTIPTHATEAEFTMMPQAPPNESSEPVVDDDNNHMAKQELDENAKQIEEIRKLLEMA